VAGGFKGPHSTKLLYFWSIMLIAGKDAKKNNQIQYPQNHLQFQWNTPNPISKMFPKKNPRSMDPSSKSQKPPAQIQRQPAGWVPTHNRCPGHRDWCSSIAALRHLTPPRLAPAWAPERMWNFIQQFLSYKLLLDDWIEDLMCVWIFGS